MPWYQQYAGEIDVWGTLLISGSITLLTYIFRDRIMVARPCLFGLGLIPFIVYVGMFIILPPPTSLPFWKSLAVGFLIAPSYALCFLILLCVLILEGLSLIRNMTSHRLLCLTFGALHLAGLSWTLALEWYGI